MGCSHYSRNSRYRYYRLYSFYSGYIGYSGYHLKPKTHNHQTTTKGNRSSANGYLLSFIPSPFTCGKVTVSGGKDGENFRELSTGADGLATVWKTARVFGTLCPAFQHKREAQESGSTMACRVWTTLWKPEKIRLQAMTRKKQGCTP